MDIANLSQVRETIARILVEYMGVDLKAALNDTPFVELHKDFDSLSMLELQLLLEKEYNVEFNVEVHGGLKGELPKNVTEFALLLFDKYSEHHSRIVSEPAQA